MIVIVSDTHSSRGHELEGAILETVTEADAVIHAGDFTSLEALEAFESTCPVFYAVHGNADSRAVKERLPTVRTVEEAGLRFALTHTRPGGETELAVFGRSRAADIVVSGHTHRPLVREAGDVLLLNPGSYAQPRGNRPGFAVLESEAEKSGYRIELRHPDGTVFERFSL